MGYTHYWEYKTVKEDTYKEDTLRVLFEITLMLEQLPEYSETAGSYYNDESIELRGGMGEGKPEFSHKRIWFNGNKEKGLDHETFLFEFNKKPVDEWPFCKTARKPYDFVVCLCLLSLANNLKGFKIFSDGNMDDWKPAIDFYKNIFGKIKPKVLKFLNEK
jgi:hypothetical protein